MAVGKGPRTRPWHVAILCTLLAFAWQWFIVAGVFQGRWSALFYAGDRFPQSQAVKNESSFVIADGYGYDGQFYHEIAHDPFDLHGTDRVVEAARSRYTRILLPGLSYLLGGGQLLWVDRAYRGLELLFLFLGVACTAALLESAGRSAWWGAAFLALPATFFSLERQLTELPACALLVAALLAVERGRYGWAWFALAASALNREVGTVVIAGFVFLSLWERSFTLAGLWMTAVIPAAVWTLFVGLKIPSIGGDNLRLTNGIMPMFTALRHPETYSYAASTVGVLHVLDWLAIAGALATMVWGLLAWTRGKTPLAAAAFALALFGLLVSPDDAYVDIYAYARYRSPLLLLQLIHALRKEKPILLAPLGAILPRAIVPGASLTMRALRYFSG